MPSHLWMPIYWGDYFADTRHLSTVQHGAYLLLIAHYWQQRSLPNDDQQLAQITGLPLGEWIKNKPVIQKFFVDGWRHLRVERELKRHLELRQKRAEAGSKGGTMASIKKMRRR